VFYDFFYSGPDGIIIPCTLTKLSTNLYRVEVRTRQVGTYNIIFNEGHKIVNSQTLQAFDPSKVSIKEIADTVCHRPGTILGNYLNVLAVIINLISVDLVNVSFL